MIIRTLNSMEKNRNSEQNGNRGNIPNIIKAIGRKPSANITLNGQKL